MIVVTGGAGFIGSNLVAAMEDRCETEILVCDRLGSDDRWRNLARRNLADLIKPDQLFDFLEANTEAVDMIFHMGAISDTTATDAELVIENNFGFTLALWEWCAAHNVRLVYASSAATYGDGANGYDDDSSVAALAKMRPLNPYAWSKHLLDRRIARLLESGANAPAQSVGLKFFNVYGPNEYHKGAQSSVVHHAWSQITDGGSVRLFRSHRDDIDDGHQARDFVHVDDCVAVMVWLLDTPSVSGLFNVGTGKARTFLELANAVFAALGVEPRIEFIDTPVAIRDRYQYFTEAPMERLRAAGFDADFLGLEDGVGRYVGEYLIRQDPYR